MRSIKKVLTAVFLFSCFTMTAMAGGDRVANGGDAVVCFKNPTTRDTVLKMLKENRGTLDDKGNMVPNPYPTAPFADQTIINDIIKPVWAFDLYEQARTGLPPAPTKFIEFSDGNPIEQAKGLLEDFSLRSSFANAGLADINDLSWVAAAGVGEVDDSRHIVLMGLNCLLVQLGSRVENIINFDEALFSLMDQKNRVAFVLHELFYFMSNKSDSRGVRKLTAALMTENRLNQLSDLQISRLVSDVNSEYKGIDSYQVVQTPVGEFRVTMKTASGTFRLWRRENITLSTGVTIQNVRHIKSVDNQITLEPETNDELSITDGIPLGIGSMDCRIMRATSVTIDQSGKFISASWDTEGHFGLQTRFSCKGYRLGRKYSGDPIPTLALQQFILLDYIFAHGNIRFDTSEPQFNTEKRLRVGEEGRSEPWPFTFKTALDQTLKFIITWATVSGIDMKSGKITDVIYEAYNQDDFIYGRLPLLLKKGVSLFEKDIIVHVGRTFYFDQDLRIHEVHILISSVNKLRVGDHTVYVKPYSYIGLYPDLSIRQCVLEEDTEIDGREILKGSSVTFNEKGEVIDVQHEDS